MIASQLIRRFVAYGILAGCVVALAASDTRPVVGPGATKDDVIKAYGWPNGQSQSGTKEILSYAQGEVILENGRVDRVNFSPDVPWQTPRLRPEPPTASTRKIPEAPVDFWVASYDDALREAERRHARVLALFTGSDWSPASLQFHDEVEYHPDFVNAFAGDFVFLKLDYPRGSPVPAKISDENVRLRDRYDVTTYPTLLVLSPAGDLLGRVDLALPDPAESFRGRVIAAVRAARDATSSAAESRSPPRLAAPTVTPAPAPVAQPVPRTVTTNSPAMAPMATDVKAVRALHRAGKLILGAVALAGVVVGFLWWRLWRPRQTKREVPNLDLAERIDAAAGGMPALSEMAAWPKAKLCAIVAGLAEFDDYAPHVRPAGSDVDLDLRKRGDVNPRVLVCCAAGVEGVVAAKRVRELFGSLAAEGVEHGWFVSPVGFTPEARAYAAAHRIALIAADGLHNMMREVPPVSLPKVLARE